jgi:signal peptidase I
MWRAILLAFMCSANAARLDALGDPPPPSESPGDTKRRVIAAILSALVPGVGQLLLGQRRKALILLILFAALVACVWPLRLPRVFPGLGAIIVIWLVLASYASSSALLELDGVTIQSRSRLWWLAIPVFVYAGLNLSFTSVFLLSGFRALKFSSSAMEPSLFPGDRFISDANYYRHRSPQVDDLIAMRRNGYITVKRVIGVSGDTIAGRDRQITLNGKLLREPFIEHSRPAGSTPDSDTFGPIIVPAGKLFVMGDNRDVSLDSREPEFGLVSPEAIVGKPLYVYRTSPHARAGKELN